MSEGNRKAWYALRRTMPPWAFDDNLAELIACLPRYGVDEVIVKVDAETLRGLFSEASLDLSRPVTTSCGSGVTAAILALGLYLIGYPDTAVYDGSWSEWGTRNDTPFEI